MTEVKRVTAQVSGPRNGDAGQITDGYYVVVDGMLIMTHPDGVPVSDHLYRHKLREFDNEKSIASILTKAVRRDMRGEIVPGFSNNISYPRTGVA